MHDPTETVVAVATPPGRGGVGCVRLSGPEADAIAARLFRPAHRSAPDETGRARFGRFLDVAGEPLDHGYLVRFDAGASYTGEDVVELWTHGSPAVLAALVDGAVHHGASPAAPGEFTYRAVVHGRIDLAQAEAIRDLVDARTRYQAKVALTQAEGALSRHLAPLAAALEELIVRGEAAVEFVDETETHLPGRALDAGIDAVRRSCQSLVDGFRFGRLVREGARLALVGRPNAGKSSLFNRLLLRERAIVTDVPGTTRDTLEEALDLDGIPVTLVDTAGLRDVDDPVEREGVARARRAGLEADVVVLVVDGSRPASDGDDGEAGLADAGDARAVVVLNKSDLPSARERPLPRPDALRVSAKTGEGCGALRSRIGSILRGGDAAVDDPILTRERHAGALRRTVAALERAGAASRSGLPEDIVLEDLRAARHHLGTITGEFGLEDLYDRVFSTFCIGK